MTPETTPPSDPEPTEPEPTEPEPTEPEPTGPTTSQLHDKQQSYEADRKRLAREHEEAAGA